MSESLPPEAYAAALSGLQRMTLRRLGLLLAHHEPRMAHAIAVGELAAPRGSMLERILGTDGLRLTWASDARRHPPEEVWARCCELGLDVSYLGDGRHPAGATEDPLPAPVLFSRGDRALLGGRRVAIVGTRNATQAGRAMAHELGRGLAAAGVHVVSGLARGVDVHAHQGALHDGGPGCPIGVVASGLDVIYPREHHVVWHRVAEGGLLLGEFPPGDAPIAHRFPLRNRLVAGLSEIVVVVESRERGGSLITAGQAADRGVPVMAVPGGTRNRAALGVNQLLRDGAAPVLDVDDVLLALSLDHGAMRRPATVLLPVRPEDASFYATCRRHPVTIGEAAELHAVDLLTAAMSLARLEQGGWLHQVDGWYEAIESCGA